MEIELDPIPWARASSIASTCTLDGLSVHTPRKPLLRSRGVRRLFIFDVLDGESVLDDDADWGAPTWSMRPEGRSALEATLTCLSQQIPEGFAFRAAWVGDKIHREVEVSRGALTELVRASRLNGGTLYRVKP